MTARPTNVTGLLGLLARVHVARLARRPFAALVVVALCMLLAWLTMTGVAGRQGRADSYSPTVVMTASGYGVVWVDERDWTDPRVPRKELYFASVGHDGKKRRVESPVTQTPKRIFNVVPHALRHGKSGVAVTWHQSRHGGRGIFFARLSATGKIRGAALQVSPSNAPADSSVRAASSGREYGIAWHSTRVIDQTRSRRHVHFARVSHNGRLLVQSVLLDFGEQGPWAESLDIAWTGSNYLLVWTKEHAINASLISRDGKVLSTRHIAKAGEASPSHLALAPAKKDFGLFWQSYRDGKNTLSLVRLSSRGDVLARRRYDRVVEAPSAVWNGSQFALAWRDGSNIYFGLLPAKGRIQPAAKLTDHADMTTGLQLVWGSGEFGVAWTDRRGRRKACYFVRLSRSGKEQSRVRLSSVGR